jgi:cell wall-associated NlpC family hydrolase
MPKQLKPRIGSEENPTPDSQFAPMPAKEPASTIARQDYEPESSARAVSTSGKNEAQAKGEPALKPCKPNKLQFEPGEAAPDMRKTRSSRKLNIAQAQAESVSGKLEKARDSLPSKVRLRKVGVTDEKSGSVKRKLQFEKTPISQGEHIKGAKLLRPAKAAGNSLMINAHRKLFQVEHENAGVKAAHRAEMIAEGGVRSALRFHKTAPYRKVAKLERAARKKSVNLSYQQLLGQNPKLKSNIISRAIQKRKIKKDYAKAAREAQKAATKVKKAGSATVDAGKAAAGAVKRHPVASVAIILIAFLLFATVPLIGAVGSLGSGGLGSIVASTYLAEDAEIYAAETAYSGMEAGLQHELDNYALLHPGCDEYRFDVDSIWHDPYVLASIVSALYEGAWTFNDVQGALATFFEQQYALTETVAAETRYRTEASTVTDPATGATTEVKTEAPYTYYICTVTLENFDLSHLPVYVMGEATLSRYALFMATLGNRPDLFPIHQYPNASFNKDYGRYDIPAEYFEDETFAAIIKEAQKYLGMPYVWGGASPATSFDCSGFVSWVLNHSGWDFGRLGAQGLYNISAPVSASGAKPGDLIFFTRTYKAENPNGVTHVGIYVGDGMMLHCGNPIGFASINTAYWQEHFYAFGKVY